MQQVQITPYAVDVPDKAVEDLRDRLARTRFPDEVNDDAWGWGTPLGVLRTVVDRWRDGFDWRAQEGRLNAFPQFMADVDGVGIHFVHVRSGAARTVPLLLSHGWPGSFVELLGLVPLLAGPSEVTAAAGLGCDLVIPSLPGFGFSDRPGTPGTSSAVVAELFTRS